jgi:hypothetical protein
MGSMTAGPYVTFVPTRKHTWKSDVRVTQLPAQIDGLLRAGGVFKTVPVPIKNSAGELLPTAIPKVAIVKGDNWYDDSGEPNPAGEKGIIGSVDMLLEKYPLAGIVGEGLAPYSSMSTSQDRALDKAVLSGLPVVKVARGDARGLVRVNATNLFIEGNNLTATKARLLLTAALMKFGPLPHAADPEHATPAEISAIKEKIKLYQAVFETH